MKTLALTSGLLIAAALYSVPCDAVAQDDAGQPNVILVMTDDQGFGDLACLGNPIIKTPNLDKLYARGIRLTNFHVDPACAPTRAALMTGRYSHRAGVWHVVMGRTLLHPDEVRHEVSILVQERIGVGQQAGLLGITAG